MRPTSGLDSVVGSFKQRSEVEVLDSRLVCPKSPEEHEHWTRVRGKDLQNLRKEEIKLTVHVYGKTRVFSTVREVESLTVRGLEFWDLVSDEDS